MEKRHQVCRYSYEKEDAENKKRIEELQEFHNLREVIRDHKKAQMSLSKQIIFLEKQVEQVNAENIRLRSGEDVKAEINKYKAKLHDRDGVIATLVKSTIAQEQKITAVREELIEWKGKKKKTRNLETNVKNSVLSWESFNRLHQESEIFAGQIIEQDEEIESLRQQLDDERQVAEDLKRAGEKIKEIQKELDNELQKRHDLNITNRKKVDELQDQLDTVEEKKNALQADIVILKSKLRGASNGTRLAQVEEELEDAEETNKNLREELRSMRKKAKDAQFEAERVEELENEYSEYKKKLETELKSTRNELDTV